MLGSITPLGERGRQRSWGVTTSWLVVGSTVGGAALGGLCGAAGIALSATGISSEALLLLLAAALTIFALVDFAGERLRLAGPTRQVNDGWMYEYRGWAYGFGFGVQLGFGIATVVVTPAIYAMMLASVATESLLVAVAVGTVFGLVRGLTALPGGRVKEPGDLVTLQAWLERTDRSSRLTIAVGQVVLMAIVVTVVIA